MEYTVNQGVLDILERAAMSVGQGEKISPHVMIFMCQAFQSHDWVGKFDEPISTEYGRHERVMAVLMAKTILGDSV